MTGGERWFWALNPEDAAFLVLVLAFVFFAGVTVFPKEDTAMRGRAAIIAGVMLVLAIAVHGWTLWFGYSPSSPAP